MSIPVFNNTYWSAHGAFLYLGEVRAVLKRLPTRSVHCAITSPPYWGLRDYDTGTWEEGSAGCDHCSGFSRGDTAAEGNKGDKLDSAGVPAKTYYKNICGKCGAVRTDNQIGMEDVADCLGWATKKPCSECFVCHMVEVFGELRRVLRDDATLWLNLGDTFDNGQGMVPAAVAMALRANGWKLVQDIIWYAPNKMPESVTNRCTKSHEHIFLLAKGNEYYFDSVAIEEQGKSAPHTKEKNNGESAVDTKIRGHGSHCGTYEGGVNKRDIWIVPTKGYKGAHFACFSSELITPCILAGTSEAGCCAECGKPYERVVSRVGGEASDIETKKDRSFPSQRNALPDSGSTLNGVISSRKTGGWNKMCGCQTTEVSQCVVLDPFVGSGTTVATAMQLGRVGVGIDLSQEYLDKNAIPRIVESVVNGRVPTVVIPQDVLPPPKRLR